MKIRFQLIASLAFALCSCGSAEQQNNDPVSTVINPDGTVTFNYRDDYAKDVKVDVQFAGRHDMVRDSLTGVWSVTLGPAAPDMYPYCFVVDGVSIMDDQCSQWFPNEGFKNSLLEIPAAGEPLVHTPQSVPHGNVDYITYYSKSLGIYDRALVYTPASYATSIDSLPVFYLISGTTDTEEVYYKVGRMNTILDNMIARGEAKEMIVVLPYGNPSKLMPPGNMAMGMGFNTDLVNDLMPYVESHYRTINDADHRAIGGFSRGGNQALSNGLMNLDKFSYLCSYSSFTTTSLPKVYDNAEETNSKIHLFWLGIGTDDFLYGTSRDYLQFLDEHGIRTVKEFTSDKFGHTWMNAKYFLSHTLRYLFNPEASEAAMQKGTPAPTARGDEQPFTPGVMARLFPRPIISPEYHNDSITFRIKAVDAKSVRLEGEMLDGAISMQRDSDGVWSATVANINPDVYCYNFDVDGLKVADASNMYLAPDKGFKRSIVDMPSQHFAVTPSDSIDYSAVVYKLDNNENGTFRHYAQCIARGWKAEGLPVITLVAGEGDTFESWYKIAQANVIMDQLIAQGKAKPCMLMMVEDAQSEIAGNVIYADDYSNWQERRKALAEMLCKL